MEHEVNDMTLKDKIVDMYHRVHESDAGVEWLVSTLVEGIEIGLPVEPLVRLVKESQSAPPASDSRIAGDVCLLALERLGYDMGKVLPGPEGE